MNHGDNRPTDPDTAGVGGDETRSPLDERQHAVLANALEEFAATMEVAIETLASNRELVLSTIRELGSGEPLADITGRLRMSDVREQLTTALHELDLSRSRARLEFFHVLQRDGHSIREIAEMWGISRQLASRLMREG